MLECWKGFAPLASGAAFPFRFIEYARRSNQSIQVHLLYLFFCGYVIFHTVFCVWKNACTFISRRHLLQDDYSAVTLNLLFILLFKSTWLNLAVICFRSLLLKWICHILYAGNWHTYQYIRRLKSGIPKKRDSYIGFRALNSMVWAPTINSTWSKVYIR